MTTTARRLSRRSWLQSAAASTALLAAPTIIPSRAFGANERVVFGFIGVGGRGMSLVEAAPGDKAAVCDVDAQHADEARQFVTRSGGRCEVYGDYRRLLDRKDIDAVCIATPDHWHAQATIDACRAGKHVYCEKPLSLTIDEGRRMVNAARENRRVVQTGLQQRSDERFRTACELVRNGRLGQLQQVLIGIPDVRYRGQAQADAAPPAGLNYDLWLGPAPERPYNVGRVHYNFRYFWDYSGGQVTNWGTHHVDIAQWALGMDNSGPVSAEGTGLYDSSGLYEVTNTATIRLRYATGVEMVIGQNQPDIPHGVTFVGSAGRLFVDRERIVTTPVELGQQPLPATAVRLPVSQDHFADFVRCLRSGDRPIADVEIGHRTATVCHLANIAVRLGRKIVWDPEREVMVGDAAAQAMTSRPYRSPWAL